MPLLIALALPTWPAACTFPIPVMVLLAFVLYCPAAFACPAAAFWP